MLKKVVILQLKEKDVNMTIIIIKTIIFVSINWNILI